MAKSDIKADDITKVEQLAGPKAAADAAPAIPWLDLFKLAFGATGDADTAIDQADRAQKKIAARLNPGA
jgi:hypothetical protein